MPYLGCRYPASRIERDGALGPGGNESTLAPGFYLDPGTLSGLFPSDQAHVDNE